MATAFAHELSDVLNHTVSNGIRLTPVTSSGSAAIGRNLSQTNWTAPAPIPLTLGKKPPSGYIEFLCRLEPDDTEGKHLMVVSSFMSFCLEPDGSKMIFHYDYERNKTDGYPEAHLQVCAEPTYWKELTAGRDIREDFTFERLHLPVGGRRNRPTLEDFVDLLITEDFADGHTGYTNLVEAGRAKFARAQLRAAVRRDPETAIEELKRLGACET